LILSSIVCESLQGEAGIILESPDQKTRFVVQIALPRLFTEHVHQVFAEMTVRYKLIFDPIFIVDLTRGLARTVPCFRYSS
jgi:hypothetical protein